MKDKGELRESGKRVDKACSICGDAVPCAITRATTRFGDRETTPPEDHSPVCRAKKMLKKRLKWRIKG